MFVVTQLDFINDTIMCIIEFEDFGLKLFLMLPYIPLQTSHFNNRQKKHIILLFYQGKVYG